MSGDRVRGHLAMLAFSALVAGSFALGAMMADRVAPIAFTALRFWIGTLLIGALMALTGGRRRSDFVAPWRYGVLGGIFAGYFVLMFEGLKTAPPVSAAAVFTLLPILTAGFGWLVLRQVTTGRMALALAIGALGAAWVIFRGDLRALLAFDVGRGEAIYFAGCLCHALYVPLVRLLNRGERAVVFTFGTLLAGAMVVTVLGSGAIRATDWAAQPAIVWITLAYTAVFATAATFVLTQYAALRLPASKVMAYTYLTPSWVILWQLALGQPAPGPVVLTGVALTALALLLLLKDEH
ncbi:MAG: DMT family transporter [Defluviimonas sp.]|uniref:DMT family transporter n=1 Tax=Albidovulum sp. TaxID=1872424 RepID=UPI001D574E16|nr:DMT family transporter [Paracoccaceae bacterium]MCC0065172.1 DMT family transporter [Defluviimonas sp.]